MLAAGLVLVGSALLGAALQSSLAGRWLLLPLLRRALAPAQVVLRSARFELPARLSLSGLEIYGADERFELRAARISAAIDLWGSQRAGRWVVDELVVDGLDLALREAEEREPRDSSFDPFRLDVRRVELRDARIARSSAEGARVALGPATFTLRDLVRGAKASAQLRAPIQLIGSDRSEHTGSVDLALTGSLAADPPHLDWEGALKLLLGPAGPAAAPDSVFEIAGELRGGVGRVRPTVVTAELVGRQGGQEAGRVEGTFVRVDAAQTTTTLAFRGVAASLLNPLLAAAGLNSLTSGLWSGELAWAASQGIERISSRVDAEDLRVRHASSVVGPFALHSRQAATLNTSTRELEVDQFELDVVLAGVSRIRGRLDQPLTLFAVPGSQRPRATAEIFVDALPMRELAALGIPVDERLWTGTLSGRSTLEVLEAAGSAAYALDLTLALPAPRKAPKAARNTEQAKLELRGRAGPAQTIEIDRVLLALRSGRSARLAVNGKGRYALTSKRLELDGSIEGGKLAASDLQRWLRAEWLQPLSVEVARGPWHFALDPDKWLLRAEPQLRGVASRTPRWRLGELVLGLVLEAPRQAPLRIQELRVRAPDLGPDAELRLSGVADLHASPAQLDLEADWQALSLPAIRQAGLLSGALADGLRSGVLAGEGKLDVDLGESMNLEGNVRLDDARIQVGQRVAGPLTSSAALALSTAKGGLSELTADVTCASERGPLLRATLRRPGVPGKPVAYEVDVALLDLGRVRSLLGGEAARSGPVLVGDLRIAPDADALPFSFDLATAAPAKDRVRGTGTVSRSSAPSGPRRVDAKLRLERVTLDPYLELFDLAGNAPAERGARASGPDLQIEGEVGEVSWKELTFQGGSVLWARDRVGSVLQFRPQRGLGGNLTGQVMLSPSLSGGQRLQWELAGDGLDAELLSRTVRAAESEPLRGTLSIRTQGGLQLGARLGQGTGRTELALTNGQFGRSQLLEFMATQTRISALRRMRFDALSADLVLSGDTLQVTAVDVRSPVAGLVMTGSVALSGALDLRVATRVGPELKQLLSATEYSAIVGGTLDRFLTLPILVLVQGSLDAQRYSVRPTTASVTSTLWDTVSGTGRLLRRGSDSLFKSK